MDKPNAGRPPRVPFVRALSLTPLGEDHTATLRFVAENLSRGGMFIRADRVLPPGTRVAVSLEAAGVLLSFAQAEVVWERDGEPASGEAGRGFGLRFTELRPRSLALVEHLVSRGGTAHIPSAAPRPQQFAAQVAAKPLRRRRWKRPVAAAVVAAAAGVVVAAVIAWPRPPLEARPTPAPAVVAAPVAPVQVATTPVVAAGRARPDLTLRESEIEIPTGAVRSVRIVLTGQEVVVEPTLRKNASIKRIFNLAKPPRLVIDVVGREPRFSWQLDGNAVVKSVRVGARDHGTRVVVDLPDPQNDAQNGYTLVASRVRP